MTSTRSAAGSTSGAPPRIEATTDSHLGGQLDVWRMQRTHLGTNHRDAQELSVVVRDGVHRRVPDHLGACTCGEIDGVGDGGGGRLLTGAECEQLLVRLGAQPISERGFEFRDAGGEHEDIGDIGVEELSDLVDERIAPGHRGHGQRTLGADAVDHVDVKPVEGGDRQCIRTEHGDPDRDDRDDRGGGGEWGGSASAPMESLGAGVGSTSGAPLAPDVANSTTESSPSDISCCEGVGSAVGTTTRAAAITATPPSTNAGTIRRSADEDPTDTHRLLQQDVGRDGQEGGHDEADREQGDAVEPRSSLVEEQEDRPVEQVDPVADGADRHERAGRQQRARKASVDDGPDHDRRQHGNRGEAAFVDPTLVERRHTDQHHERTAGQRAGQPTPTRHPGHGRGHHGAATTMEHPLREADTHEQFRGTGVRSVVDEIPIGGHQRRQHGRDEQCPGRHRQKSVAAAQGHEHHDGQEQVDLLLDCQRPEVRDRARIREEDVLVARRREREPPVGDIGHRRHEVTGQVGLLIDAPPRPTHRHAEEARVRRGKQPTDPPSVEVSQGDRSALFALGEQQRRDEKAREREKQRHAEESARRPWQFRVEEHDRDHRHGAEPVQPRFVFHGRKVPDHSGSTRFVADPAMRDTGDPMDVPGWWDERPYGLLIHTSVAAVPSWAPIGMSADRYRTNIGDSAGRRGSAAHDGAIPMATERERPMVEALAHHRDRWGHIEHFDDFVPLLTFTQFDSESWARLAVDAGCGFSGDGRQAPRRLGVVGRARRPTGRCSRTGRGTMWSPTSWPRANATISSSAPVFAVADADVETSDAPRRRSPTSSSGSEQDSSSSNERVRGRHGTLRRRRTPCCVTSTRPDSELLVGADDVDASR